MSILEAFILGLVQGLTEFLPVSSSGHTILAGKLMGLYEVPLAFELIIHFATLLALVIVMRKKIFPLVRHPICRENGLILAASVPTVIAVLILKPLVMSAMSGNYLIYCFLITAALIIISGMRKPKMLKMKMSYLDAVIVGTVQGFAAMPGISRSGSTICASTLLGHSREQSADFSFLISIPVIIGSTAFEIIGNTSAIGISAWPLIIGFFTAFVSGLFGIKILMKIFAKHSLDGFAIYLVILSAFILVNNLFLHIF